MFRILTAISFSLLLCLYSGVIAPSCTADNRSPSQIKFPKDKWVYMNNPLRTTDNLSSAESTASDAKSHGLNGIALSGGLDTVTKWSKPNIDNLREFKSYCDGIGIEIIPMIFSAGYGGAVLNHNPNLAEALPFVDAPFTVHGNVASADVYAGNLIDNPGFELVDSKSGTLLGFDLLEKLNEIVLLDQNVKHSGNVSVRLENFKKNPYGHARIVKVLDLHPYSEYQFTCWVKTDSVTPVDSMKVVVYQSDMKRMLPSEYFAAPPKGTQDWTRFTFRFKTVEQTSGRLYMGTWGAKSGRMWIDDIEVVEMSPARDIVRRPGTPITVRSADRNLTFNEGIDFEPVPELKGNAYLEGPQVEIHLIANSRIKPEEKLLISGYSVARLMSLGHHQIPVCMSEEETYQIWTDEVNALYGVLKMKKAFLSMDEIRAGGSCKACKDRNMTMAQILGDCFTRQMKILRALDPNMEIYTWSDMLDPNTNARDNYFYVDGSYYGSWNYVPKDLIMVAWVYAKRTESLRFFSENGFQTMGAPYYDKKSLADTIDWYKEVAQTPQSIGIMYTTWINDYSYLIPFADYLQSQQKK